MRAFLVHRDGFVEQVDVEDRMVRAGYVQAADLRDRQLTPGNLQVESKHVKIATFKLREALWEYGQAAAAIFDEVTEER